MKINCLIAIIAFLFICLITYAQTDKKRLTIDNVIDTLSLVSSSARIERLNFKNDLLLFEIYKKGLLPALSFTFNPINFNRSLRVLQQPSDGSYSYVEDYSNNSSMGISIKQKIGLTGGVLNIGSDLNYLNEFSRKQNSFSTTPFTIGYSQQLWGGRKIHRWEKDIEYAKNQVAIKRYCTKISQIQQEASALFMSALLNKMESELALQNRHQSYIYQYRSGCILCQKNNPFFLKQEIKKLESEKYALWY